MNEQCKKELLVKQMRLLNEIRDKCVAQYGGQVLNKLTPPLVNSATGGE